MIERLASQLPLAASRNGGGVFFANSALGAKDFADGMSKTMLVAEIIVVPGNDMRGIMHYPEACLYHNNNTPNSSTADRIRSTHCVTANEAPCIGAYANWSSRSMTLTARSNHPGGVHLLLGDGSVHFVVDNISLAVWQALSTPKAISGEVMVTSLDP
jgi:hypothetical protein